MVRFTVLAWLVGVAVLMASASPALAAPVKLVSFRADSASGTGPYAVPGNAGPWQDLTPNNHDGDVENFLSNGASGWEGNGTHSKPYGLYWDGEERRVVVPAGSITELQDSTQAVTAGMWFKTGFDGPKGTFDYLMEWVQQSSPSPEFEGRGMSIAISDGKLQVYQNAWVDAGVLAPNTWYHVVVAKASNDLRVYLNGARTYTGTHPHMGRQLSPLTLGCSVFRYMEGFTGDDVYGDYFTGTIAQAAVWKDAMTDDEALAEFRADSARYLPNEAPASTVKLVEFRADSADGSTHRPVPGNAGPWVDLAGTPQNGVLANFAGTDTTSGWAGIGVASSPYRLAFDGDDDAVAIAAGSIPELQERTETTTMLWFKTGPNVASSTYRYLVEYISGLGTGQGTSMAIADGQLQVYLRVPFWQEIAPVTSNTWYHAAVVKRLGGVTVYLNGTPVFTGTKANVGTQGTELVLGSSAWRGPQVYDDVHDGSINQFTLWRGALSASQVRAAFQVDSVRYFGSSGPFTITASAGAHGTISPSGAVPVSIGGTQTFTITADSCYVPNVVVDGGSVGAVTSYTFTSVVANHTISATFSLGGSILTASAGAGGTIAPSGAVTVACGSNQTFTIAADDCHDIANVLVDGVSVGAVSSYSFTNVTVGHTIAASFSTKSITITASAGANGSISPSGSVAVPCGHDTTFTMSPSACFAVSNVLVDGVSVGAVTSYTFTNVTAAHTIAASFAASVPTLTATAGANGSISPSGAVPVACGNNQTFTMTPSAGFRVDDVKVDGVSVGPVTSYAFTNVGFDHTIAATFAPSSIKLLSFRADSGSGATPYDVPGNAGPWQDLTPNHHDGDVQNFLSDGGSGWEGNGSHSKPYGLYWDGEARRVVVPAASIPELQDSTQAVTAGLWFKTSFDGPKDTYDYLLEWVQQSSPNPEFEGRGMSIAINNGKLQVYQNAWVDAAVVAPNTWYHVVVAKAANDLRVYVNGVRTYTGTHPHMGRQLSPLTLGCSVFRYFDGFTGDDVYGDYFTGTIAQAAVWKGAMTDGEALAEFRADSAQYLPNVPTPSTVKLVEFRGDAADGTTHYPVPGAAGPWVDLAGTPQNGVLANFTAPDTSSGWNGTPYRLEFDGVNDAVAIAAGSIPELQERTESTTMMWFKTGPNVASSTYRYLVEYISGYGSGQGVAMAIADGQLQVYLRDPYWVNVAAVEPNTWYHAVVVKKLGGSAIYLNGALVYSGTKANVGTQGTELVLGSSAWHGPQAYADIHDGAIGGFVLWRGALDASQVLASFRADSAQYLGTPGGPLAVESAAAAVSMHLAGARPNPARVAMRVAFTLPSEGPATLELLDLAGRRVRSTEVGTLGAGSHSVDLAKGSEMPSPGVYWIRLSRAGQSLVSRVAVVR